MLHLYCLLVSRISPEMLALLMKDRLEPLVQLEWGSFHDWMQAHLYCHHSNAFVHQQQK